ncbi:peptidoglycan DD-metalloendopeptidase family protein [Nocardia abscessus]|uniref:peptidoglycan DD-metalloendopeptidase family protein n=1 Tax=Nocardia abscessus TaxID=120957 RepID=UPI0024558EA0|nr:peptidoglycan DD-metalloendopeptidase family protein [Nocardia abscessus]
MTWVFALLRYRRVIVAVVLVVLLIVAECGTREKTQNGCARPGAVSAVGGLAYPVDPGTPISSGYGLRDGGEFHRGVDFAVPVGTPVRALADGTVTAAQDHGVSGFGGWVVISHVIDGNPMSTVYGHMDPGGVHVQVGQQVRAGDIVAASGNSGASSGPHLHFELHEGNRLAGGPAIDPTAILQRIKDGETTTSGGDIDQQAAAVAPGDDVVDRNATAIIAAGLADNVPEEGIVLALAVGLAESELHNLASEAVPESKSYPNDGVTPGDYDSVGVLQQRVSMGYGSVEQLMDPQYQAHGFYKRLLASNWRNKSFTEAAADIQQPRADFRDRYGQREAEARALFARLVGHAAHGGACAPTNPTTPPSGGSGQGAAIVAEARRHIGLPYVWGGGDTDGPTGGGFDCSGLTMRAVYVGTGASLPHYTGDSSTPGQLHQGTPVPDIAHAQPGDLVFFGSGQDASHVGIFTGLIDGVPYMVHAPTEDQTVTEARADDGGILIGIRRYTAPATITTAPTPAPAVMSLETR